MNKDKKDYEVGYGKPPKHSQFKKGQSGNPKGKPKGSCNLKTDVISVLNSRIVVNENGQTRKVSTQLATLMRLRERALQGDSRAMDRLLMLAADYNNEETPRDQAPPISEDDAAILEDFRRRVLGETRQCPKTDSADEEDNND